MRVPVVLLVLLVPTVAALSIDPIDVASQTVYVSAKGTTTHVVVGNGVFEITVSGTYLYGSLSRFYADASRNWGSSNGACYDWPDDVLDLRVDGISPWNGDAPPARVPPPNGAIVTADEQGCRSDHTYKATYVCVNFCRMGLSILDTSYADNSGQLKVVVAQKV